MPQVLWVLFTGVAIARIGFAIIPFRVIYLVGERQLSPASAGLVMTAFAGGWTLAQPIGGWLADHYGRRTAIVVSAWSAAGTYLLFGAANHPEWIILSAALAGLTFDMYRPAVQAVFSDTVNVSRRSQAFGLLCLVINLGRAAACVLGGLLATDAFWLIFVLACATNLAFGTAVFALAAKLPNHTVDRPRWTVALTDKALLRFSAITLGFFAIHWQTVATLPVMLADAGVSPTVFGLLLALDPVAVAVAQIAFAPRINSLPAIKVCAAGIAAVGVGLAITGLGATAGWYALTAPLWVTGELAFLTAAPSVVASLAPRHLRGTYYGLWGCTVGAGALAAPAIAAALTALAGTNLLWVCTAAGAITIAGLCLRGAEKQRPTSEPT